MYDLDKDFKAKFPKLSFQLTDFQKQSISNVITEGNTLCIMPTGGGKSVIYWMAAAELGGITIVVSPLTALISEQAKKIRDHGYIVFEMHSGIDAGKQMKLMKDLANRLVTPNFIFASPEKIATDGFFEYCLKCRRDDVKLMVIDEVHCVSQWGINFRPFYKRIPDFLNNLFDNGDWCRILALTATLNPKELGDICSSFHIDKKNIVKQTLLMRNEIQLHVSKFANEKEKEERFWDILKIHRGEKTLVYIYRKKGERSVEGLCEVAIEKGYKAEYFHGEMDSQERMSIIEKYRAGDIDIVFATNAFGMGIDIPDIRVVIHFMIPESAEQYYQEIGRAARDRSGANAYLLYSDKNIDVKRKHFIDRSFPDEKKLTEVFRRIAKKPGIKVIPYFEDEDLQDCLPYYLESGVIKIIGKGFAELSGLTNIKDPKVKEYYESTKTKGYVNTLKKNKLSAKELSDDVYRTLVEGTAKADKPLSRWLVIDVKNTEIREDEMVTMLSHAEEKRRYKHELLDYFVYVIDNNSNSQYLHQEMGRYLGMDKHQLKRIYETKDRNHVRSKSEVIICNLLYNAGIHYEYEKKLFYEDEKWIEPDFTISLQSGSRKYWEHVGLLGNEEYDDNWVKKLDIYENYFPGQLIRTYESGALSNDAQRIIDQLLAIIV